MSSVPTRQNQWFQPGEGIAREVITADIQRYLGNDALVRPGEGTGEYEGVPGYWITAYRNLTSPMLDDLRLDSRRWRAEVQQGRVAYQDSRTHQSRQYYGPTTPANPADYAQPAPQQQQQQPQQQRAQPAHPVYTESYTLQPYQVGAGQPQSYTTSAYDPGQGQGRAPAYVQQDGRYVSAQPRYYQQPTNSAYQPAQPTSAYQQQQPASAYQSQQPASAYQQATGPPRDQPSAPAAYYTDPPTYNTGNSNPPPQANDARRRR